MLYTWMFVALVAFSSLNKVTMQDSSMLPSGHSNCSSAKKPVTSPVWCSNLLRYWVRVDVLPDLLDGLDVLLIHASHAAGREAGGQVEQQGVLPKGQADREGERPEGGENLEPSAGQPEEGGHSGRLQDWLR